MKQTIKNIQYRLDLDNISQLARLLQVSRQTMTNTRDGVMQKPVLKGSLELIEKLTAEMTAEQIQEAMK